MLWMNDVLTRITEKRAGAQCEAGLVPLVMPWMNDVLTRSPEKRVEALYVLMLWMNDVLTRIPEKRAGALCEAGLAPLVMTWMSDALSITPEKRVGTLCEAGLVPLVMTWMSNELTIIPENRVWHPMWSRVGTPCTAMNKWCTNKNYWEEGWALCEAGLVPLVLPWMNDVLTASSEKRVEALYVWCYEWLMY